MEDDSEDGYQLLRRKQSCEQADTAVAVPGPLKVFRCFSKLTASISRRDDTQGMPAVYEFNTYLAAKLAFEALASLRKVGEVQ